MNTVIKEVIQCMKTLILVSCEKQGKINCSRLRLLNLLIYLFELDKKCLITFFFHLAIVIYCFFKKSIMLAIFEPLDAFNQICYFVKKISTLHISATSKQANVIHA